MDITRVRELMPGTPEAIKGAFMVAGSALIIGAVTELQTGDLARGAICLVAGLAVFAVGEKVLDLF